MATSEQTRPHRVRPPFPSLGWWVRDRQGAVALVQVPNPPLCLWLVCDGLSRVGGLASSSAEAVSQLGAGALVAWALDEVLRGASPARRLLGALVLPLVLWRALA